MQVAHEWHSTLIEFSTVLMTTQRIIALPWQSMNSIFTQPRVPETAFARTPYSNLLFCVTLLTSSGRLSASDKLHAWPHQDQLFSHVLLSGQLA